MEKQFNPTHAEKFGKGQVEEAPERNKEENEKIKKELMDIMNEDIDFMRLKNEYDKLQIEGYENAVLLGKLEPKNVPGLLGLELMRRDLEMQAFLYRQKIAMEEAMEEEKKRKESKKASDIITP